ncbi:MAG: lipopolysaccharide biosynthesis protein [Gammaproteobacteria bacterium]|nr:lipopolysaccharide biosynthesis protein [Gammaproteobacteria bacterium]
MEEQTKELSEYLDAFKRRRGLILIVTMAISIIGIAVAMLLPPSYKSSATILIEAQEIPQDLIRSTVTSYASERIQVISQRVMTRKNLLELVDKYNLYADRRKKETTEEIVGRMRENIDLNMIQSDVITPGSGSMTATIAFTLSYTGENPAMVQKVTSELTSLYLNENLKTRTEKTAETYQFLTAESERLSNRIGELDKSLADFKEINLHRLPELKSLNMQLMERTEANLRDTENQIRASEGQKRYIEGQLATILPNAPALGSMAITDPLVRLKILRVELLSASTKYTEGHPDLIALQRQVRALEEETGDLSGSSLEDERIKELRSELITLKERYSDTHPDIVKLKRELKDLERKAKSKVEHVENIDDITNPAYISLHTQLETINSEIHALQERKEDLQSKMLDYEQRLIETPQVERAFSALSRDYDNTVARYQEIKAKELEARIAQKLEQERKGERFTLIEPPQFPEEPTSPNRPGIIFISIVLALGCGVGSAALLEALDDAIRSPRAVANILTAAPLASIPLTLDPGEILKRPKRRWWILLALIITAITGALIIHFFVTPLDVLWFRALRKIDRITDL